MAAWREDAAHGQIFGAKPGVDPRDGIEREADRRFFLFADGNRITAAAADRVALSGHEDLKTEPALIGEAVTLGRVERQSDAVATRRRAGSEGRPEARRVGKEGRSTCRSRWSTVNDKNKTRH